MVAQHAEHSHPAVGDLRTSVLVWCGVGRVGKKHPITIPVYCGQMRIIPVRSTPYELVCPLCSKSLLIAQLVCFDPRVEVTARRNPFEMDDFGGWLVDDRKIKVSVNKNKVTLRGSVESLFQKDEAERLAWNAPGVVDVVNELAVLQD